MTQQSWRSCTHVEMMVPGTATPAASCTQAPGSTGLQQPGPSSSTQAASVPAPAPAASFHLPLSHSSESFGLTPWLGTSCSSSTVSPALLGRCSGAAGTEAQSKLCEPASFSSFKCLGPGRQSHFCGTCARGHLS